MTARARRTKRGAYHHGELRAALIDAAIDVIAERGIHGFSLAETSRRLGVTVAAPYSHFADRDELLAAVALRATEIFAATLTGETPDSEAPADRLAAAARGYVRFAGTNRPLFEVLFSAGLNKHDYPELEKAARHISERFLEPARALWPDDEDDADNLASTVAHGHATLLLDGAFGSTDAALDTAMTRVAHTTHAIVLGREAIMDPSRRAGNEQ